MEDWPQAFGQDGQSSTSCDCSVPRFLDCGTPTRRLAAMRLAIALGNPKTLDQLREFAFGDAGPDALRLQTARALCEAGFLASGAMRLWVDGRWRLVLVVGFRLHNESSRRLRPEVARKQQAAVEALRCGAPAAAEQLLHEAIALEPDSPELLNNLAAVYEAQGRREAARRLTEECHRKHPEYLFARVNVAHFRLQAGDVAEAKRLVHPLLFRRRLQASQFAALAAVHVAIHVAEGEMAAARLWFEVWQKYLPTHPGLAAWRGRL
jgi:tetratricopeptide (TPR) repeat protein